MSENVVGPGRTETAERTAAMEGMSWRVPLSIAGPIAWLSFTLLYVGFWAQGFTAVQSAIVIVVSILVLGGVMGTAWAAWGMRHARLFPRD